MSPKIWESAPPPTHIWERSPKKRVFYSFPFCQTVFSGTGISLLLTKTASRRNKIYLWVSICHLIFRFLLHPSIHDFASTFKVYIMKSVNFSSKGCIEFTRLWSVLLTFSSQPQRIPGVWADSCGLICNAR